LSGQESAGAPASGPGLPAGHGQRDQERRGWSRRERPGDRRWPRRTGEPHPGGKRFLTSRWGAIRPAAMASSPSPICSRT